MTSIETVMQAGLRKPWLERCAAINLCRGVLAAALIVAVGACGDWQQDPANKTLLAVFAHPDDESTVAPILSKYRRMGARVVLVIATDGRYGTNEFSGIPAGDGLAEVRAREMQCAAEALGVELRHLDYHDQLKAGEGYDGHIPHVRALIRDIARIITELQPDAIITWGADGGTNHLDHRLIEATVTGVYLSKDWGKPMSLYYVGTPASLIEDSDDKALRGVFDRYMTTAIAYDSEDFSAATESLRCHASQFTLADVERMMNEEKKMRSVVYLRKLEPPGRHSTNVF